jgi:hypothetical protein
MPDPKAPSTDTVKAKVVLVGVKDEKDRYEVVKALAQQLGVTFEEAGELMAQMPAELIPSIPLEAGEQFAAKLTEAGALVEVLPIGRAAGRFCSTHSHRRARAKCKDPGCDRYICEICVQAARGKLLCPDHYAAYRRRVLVLTLGSLVGVFLTGYLWLAYGYSIQRRFKDLYVDTTRVAVLFTARSMNRVNAKYFLRMSETANPGAYQPGDEHTFADVDGWFQREYERVAGGQINVAKIDIYGVYELTDEVPRPARLPGFSWEAYRANRRFHRFIDELVAANNLDLAGYDHRLLVEMVAETGVPSDYMEQLGVVHQRDAYVRIPVRGALSNDYYVMALAHYVGRLLGATPQLDEHGYPLFPAGYAEPNKSPRYPQEKAELMGCYIPRRAFEIDRVTSMDQAVIGPRTAYQLGWLSKTLADAAYGGVAP